MFSSLFPFSHNGGTWFVSCIIICYLAAPFVVLCIKQMGRKERIIMGGICAFILLYCPIIQIGFATQSIYSNPMFRLLEFIIGCILASETKSVTESKWGKILSHKFLIGLEGGILVVGVTVASFLGIKKDYMLYSWIGLPMFCLIILGVVISDWKYLIKSKILNYLSKISYAFFLAQFFVWPIMRILDIPENILRIMVALLLCVLIAVIFHELIEKPSKKMILKNVHNSKNM